MGFFIFFIFDIITPRIIGGKIEKIGITVWEGYMQKKHLNLWKDIDVVLDPCCVYNFPNVTIGYLDEGRWTFLFDIHYRVEEDGEWSEEKVSRYGYCMYHWEKMVLFELNLVGRGNELYISSEGNSSFVLNKGDLMVKVDKLSIIVKDTNNTVVLVWEKDLKLIVVEGERYIFNDTRIGTLKEGKYNYEATINYLLFDSRMGIWTEYKPRNYPEHPEYTGSFNIGDTENPVDLEENRKESLAYSVWNGFWFQIIVLSAVYLLFAKGMKMRLKKKIPPMLFLLMITIRDLPRAFI